MIDYISQWIVCQIKMFRWLVGQQPENESFLYTDNLAVPDPHFIIKYWNMCAKHGKDKLVVLSRFMFTYSLWNITHAGLFKNTWNSLFTKYAIVFVVTCKF